jgi:hypothetical protein
MSTYFSAPHFFPSGLQALHQQCRASNPQTSLSANVDPEAGVHDLECHRKYNSRRASHNLVEKRYRVNLNSKFRQLEDLVHRGTDFLSSLKPTTTSPSRSSSAGGNSTSSKNRRSIPASSMASNSTGRQQSSKASIIDNALRYIEQLQCEKHQLERRIQEIENRKTYRGDERIGPDTTN